jgi:hypothetical protein
MDESKGHHAGNVGDEGGRQAPDVAIAAPDPRKGVLQQTTLGQEDGKKRIENALEGGNVMHYPTA